MLALKSRGWSAAACEQSFLLPLSWPRRCSSLAGRNPPRLQTTEKVPAELEKNRPKLVVFKPGEPVEQAHDGGAVRFLVSSEDTKGAWSLVQVTEKPGYKTNVHRHNRTDEAFYILEGVLTVKINDVTSEYPAGSYVLIPRGTPHAQGNLGKVAVKLLSDHDASRV